MLSVVLVGDEYEQADCLFCEGEVGGVEALDQHHLPPLKTLLVDFDQLVQAADPEVLHVVVAVVEELV